jgi:hypothetical protein
MPVSRLTKTVHQRRDREREQRGLTDTVQQRRDSRGVTHTVHDLSLSLLSLALLSLCLSLFSRSPRRLHLLATCHFAFAGNCRPLSTSRCHLVCLSAYSAKSPPLPPPSFFLPSLPPSLSLSLPRPLFLSLFSVVESGCSRTGVRVSKGAQCVSSLKP